jgi:hypothetical protein
MAYNLFLDDKFTPHEVGYTTTDEKERKRYLEYKWVIVKTYDDFVACVKDKGIPSIVSFDHDLCDEHYEYILLDENWNKKDDEIIIDYDSFETKTGCHAAEWLIEYCSNYRKTLPIMMVHSKNKIGRKNIINLIT